MPFTACLAMMMCVIIQQHQIGPLALAVTPTQFRIPLHVVLKTNLKLMQKQNRVVGCGGSDWVNVLLPRFEVRHRRALPYTRHRFVLLEEHARVSEIRCGRGNIHLSCFVLLVASLWWDMFVYCCILAFLTASFASAMAGLPQTGSTSGVQFRDFSSLPSAFQSLLSVSVKTYSANSFEEIATASEPLLAWFILAFAGFWHVFLMNLMAAASASAGCWPLLLLLRPSAF